MVMHRADDEWLMDYAAGSLCEAGSLAIATHLALCAEARDAVRRFEQIGGVFIEECDGAPLSEECFEALMARLDDAPGAEEPRAPRVGESLIPAPLASYIGGDPDALSWRKVVKGLQEYRVECPTSRGSAKLLRAAPGVPMPRHSHRGEELTVVLTGGFSDRGETYHRGDVALADETVDHAPVALPGEDCLCLAVTSAPLRLTGLMGRVLSPFVRL